ncbi:small ribosomal subunit Rsm22 family protein [Pseudodesulfovibrio sp.]|uniref:small ribosomal subunit Rsm22 family protein n=1 Tax=unclassified Pseudodesulfovibrio TaxID=2661612 RepID=UPI003B00383E
MSIDRLFPELTDENREALDRFDAALKAAWPLKSKHRGQLKYDIRDMSRGLTSERADRRVDYMGDAKFLSPYVYYFLPWNLYRLSRLFAGLSFDVPDGARVADLGSGPLTSVIALWLARPHLRERALEFTCLDRSHKAMQVGRDLFTAVAGKDSPWRIHTVKGAFTDHLREKADLVIAANAFNELDWSGRVARPQAAKLAEHLAGCTTETGRVLIVETGVRLAGRIIADLRTSLLEDGFKPIAPCPHVEACPMPATGTGAPWCHFNLSAKGAPDWLQSLSREARLEKAGVSLNFLYASRQGAKEWGGVRIISEPFKVDEGRGQYACSHKGLTLVEYGMGGPGFEPGSLIVPDWPAAPKTDLKSGAVILPYKGRR